MRTPADRVEVKRGDIDIAARALFEQYKAGAVEELQCREWDWDTLPDAVTDFEHPLLCKAGYRREVEVAVEALWRAGRLT